MVVTRVNCGLAYCRVLRYFSTSLVSVFRSCTVFAARVWELEASIRAHVPGIAYCSRFDLQNTQWDFSFRVAIYKFCVLRLMEFLSSALIGASFGLRKAFHVVIDLILESVFRIPFCVRELVDAVWCFKMIRQWFFDAPLAFLAYRSSAEIKWKGVCYVGRLS